MSQEVYFPKRGGKKQAKKFKRWLNKQQEKENKLQNIFQHYSQKGARKAVIHQMEIKIQKKEAAQKRRELKEKIDNPYTFDPKTTNFPSPIKTQPIKPQESVAWLTEEPEIRKLLDEMKTLEVEIQKNQQELSKGKLRHFVKNIRPPGLISPLREDYPATSAKDNAKFFMDPPSRPASPCLDLFLDDSFVLEF